MKLYAEWMKQLTILTQLGLSLIMPLLLCLFACYEVTKHFGVGPWIYIIGFFFGLGGSFMTAYKVYLSVLKKEDKKGQKPVAKNRH